MKISADRLRDVRRHLDLTQAEMAEHLGVSQRTIVNWETSGVPDSKEARVHRLLKGPLGELDLINAHANAPIPEPTAEELAEWQASYEANYESQLPIGHPTNGLSPSQRMARLLDPFSTVDLLNELRRRSLEAGSKPSVWNAERVERYQQFVAPKWEDPDYSNMSEREASDYGLAAKEADEHIGHDELPNEP